MTPPGSGVRFVLDKHYRISTLDRAQAGLDAGGFAGPAGPFADAANGAISAVRGHWLEAGISVVAMVPLAGDSAKAAYLAGKYDKLIPDKAIETLARVRDTGKAPDGYVGGRTFENREGRLPQDGSYKEYDVDPKPESGPRNAERLVVDQDTGRAFYTPDHYETFEEIEY